MQTLIVEDDFTSRIYLQEVLNAYGRSDIAVNGQEAVDAVTRALEADNPYDLICLDIMMPEMSGQQALVAIRNIEARHDLQIGKGAKIIMTTALSDKDNILTSFREQCDGYLVKPVDKGKLIRLLSGLGLLDASKARRA